jgi:NodT family efflux transporter outer membrane factor (OMF) lipoprotein
MPRLRAEPRPCRLILACAWLLTLGGCASLVPPQGAAPLPDLPAAWASAEPGGVGHATPLASWWNRFDDPLLGQLVKQALQANTSVLGAQAALRQARALRDVAAAGLGPNLGSSASAQHGTSGGHSTGNLFRLGLDASWELDIFGGKQAALDVSEATARASAASLADVQVSIAAETGLSYITLRNAQARLAIASDNLAGQLETLQLTDWRVQAGLLSSLEGEQARASAEQTRAALPALQTSVEQARHALAVLTGQPPAALATTLAAASPVPQAAGDLALSMPAATLRQRPDVRAAEYAVSAAAARVSQAEAARLPSFNLGGSVGLSALTLGALTNSASLATSLLASVSLPLFDGGAARAQVRAQEAALAQTQLSYRATVLTALKDVEDALVALRGDRERVARLRLAAEAATNANGLARQRYSSGLVDFQTVLDTQRTQLSAQDNLASAGADISADHVRLYKALGGGWTPDATDTASTETRPWPQ